MSPNAPHFIACAGLICSAAVAIGCPDRPYAFWGIFVMTLIFYSHTVGVLGRQKASMMEIEKKPRE